MLFAPPAMQISFLLLGKLYACAGLPAKKAPKLNSLFVFCIFMIFLLIAVQPAENRLTD